MAQLKQDDLATPERIVLARESDFCLGRLLVRPATREVVLDGDSSSLEPRVMQALVVLGRKTGQVVSRDQLVEQCWAGRVVGEDAINRCIAKVRRLGVTSGAFEIQTIPRVGYRLKESGKGLHAGRLDRRAVMTAGAAAALAAGGFGAWELIKPSSAGPSDSIAVLPFANLSGDPSQGYFSDGVAEEIRNALTRLPGLNVIGAGSSEAVRKDDPKSAAKKLGVATILTGSVRRSSSTIRITAELIDGRTGVEKWSQEYDRPPGDVIEIESDIATNVANALRIALGMAKRAALTVGGTSNAQAQDLLFQAQRIENFSKQGNQQKLRLIERAIALDPDYAYAYAQRASNLSWFARWFPHSQSERATALSQAERSARRALELAPGLPDAHAAMSGVLAAYLRLAEAQEEEQRAIALAPGNTDFLGHYAFLVAGLGDASKALRIIDRAVALDPLAIEPRRQRLFILYLGRRYQESLAELRLIPSDATPPMIASTFILLGRNEEAKDWLKKVAPNSPLRLDLEAMMLARTGDRAGAIAIRNRLKQLYGDAANYEFAKIDAQLHDTDEAIGDLERAWENKEANLMFIRVEPWLDPIRGDPRFAALVNKMELPRV